MVLIIKVKFLHCFPLCENAFRHLGVSFARVKDAVCRFSDDVGDLEGRCFKSLSMLARYQEGGEWLFLGAMVLIWGIT